MTLLERWEQRRREIQAAAAAGRMNAVEAAAELEHLEYRINRRPLILKRRKDRNAYRVAKARESRAHRLPSADTAQTDHGSE